MEGSRERGLRALRRGGAAALVCVFIIGLGACGSNKPQDESEPKGRFQVDVTRATFPEQQKLAKRSNLVITVHNSGDRTVPNVAVTVNGFYYRVNDRQLADPTRPIFVINGKPKSIGTLPEEVEDAPKGETAYVGTWALGPLRPGRDKTFRWSVTAVKAGPFRISYTVAAGLNGKAKAVDASGRRPQGVFAGTVQEKAPISRVADDGETVVRGTR